ncbi:RcnB family protein [Sphingomonas rubra]|uniref:Regulator RcnB of Ni and Co efflux n=1 Tax=Sphingomonas rubra TaxID=634430 RepID=A0A1I5TXR0_9SPHN|nr:RcnB family protein [Sphingomonas rubra]SFP87843.1 regulator RcnB of Ni and Co efflux [Sphingomonas rubra]
MRTIILAALAAATAITPVAASAQSYGEARRSQREVRESRRDLAEASAYGSRGDIREARRELRDDRREARQDWRDYRRTHRGVYTRPGYAGPRGYRYRPVAVGHRFAPAYYGRDYWVNDYARYRLPRPGYGYQRWVRYGNDVVLVDTRNGRTLQVYDRFFY